MDEFDSCEAVVIGDGQLPAPDDGARRVRAASVRLLLLGEDPDYRPHEKGVRLIGAWIVGTPDLEGCRAPSDLGLVSCRFEAAPVLRSSDIDSLYLIGSKLPGISADRLQTTGDVILRGFEAFGEVRFLGRN